MVYTPVKKAEGADQVDAANKLCSTYVSRMRQPIESLFRWLISRVGLQDGSWIRSGKGVWLHCFGWLAAGPCVRMPFQIVNVVFSFAGSCSHYVGRTGQTHDSTYLRKQPFQHPLYTTLGLLQTAKDLMI